MDEFFKLVVCACCHVRTIATYVSKDQVTLSSFLKAGKLRTRLILHAYIIKIIMN